MPDGQTRRIIPSVLARSRELRHPQTPAELRLWLRLRNQHLGGFKFRRQHPIDRFVVDFYCAACMLIVEVDGDSHLEQADYDAARTQWLNQHGYTVVRYTNRDVFERIEGVLSTLLAECQRLRKADSPSP